MTPVGHFMCASALAGNVDIIKTKETLACFAYYVLFLIVFYVCSLFFAPGKWAMYLHDQFGNAALLFFIIFWGNKGERKQLFVLLLIGGQVLSAYTHMFDVIVLKISGSIPVGMWRPHNILHTPLAAFIVPLIALPFVRLLMKRVSLKKAYYVMALGYFLHIFADTVTYDYQLFPLWPFSGFHFSLVGFFQRPDVVSRYLGAPLYVFEKSTVENIDGFIVYQAEVLINVLLAVFFFIKLSSRKILRLENSSD